MRFWNVYNLDDTKNQKQDIPTPLYSLGGTFVNIYQYYFCRAQDIQTLLFWLKESLGSNASRRGVEPRHLGQVVVWHLGRHDACFFFSGCPGGGWGAFPWRGGSRIVVWWRHVMKPCAFYMEVLQNFKTTTAVIHKLPTLFQKPCHIMPYPIPAWLRRDYLKTVVVGQDFTLFDVFPH